MELTKYGHACFLIEHQEARILIDPGVYSHGFETLSELTAILITHQHADHIDVKRLQALLHTNDAATLYADEGTIAVLAESGITATMVHPGDHINVGTQVDIYGRNHAAVHDDMSVVSNVGYLIGERFFHPGDSFTIPDVDIEILGLPTAAPWLKASESIDYMRAITPHIAVPIHESIVKDPTMYYRLFERLAPEETDVRIIAADEAVRV
jgi:L-ascorbate metabolism protein UlaG (beta-lactamase superfamily)